MLEYWEEAQICHLVEIARGLVALVKILNDNLLHQRGPKVVVQPVAGIEGIAVT